MVGWLEPLIEDVVMEVAMALGVALGYAAWWIAIRLGSLDLDELDSGSDDVVSPPSEEED